MSRRSDTTQAMIAFTASIAAVTLWLTAESSATQKKPSDTSAAPQTPRSGVSPSKDANRCAHSTKGVGFLQEPHHE